MTELYLNISTGIIKDQDGRIIKIEEARKAWKDNKIRKCNRYFYLLARCGFNVELTKLRYKGWKKEDYIMTFPLALKETGKYESQFEDDCCSCPGGAVDDAGKAICVTDGACQVKPELLF